MPQLRNNPINVVTPGGDNTFKPAQIPQLAPEPKLVPEPKKVGPLSTVSFEQEGGILSDPAAGAQKSTKGTGKIVNITAFGNKLIITSDDPEALSLAQELVRLMTKTEYGEGDFQVIRLKNAGATEIAKIIDEAFNGPKGGAGGGKGPAGGGNPLSMLTGGLGGMLQSAIGGAPAQRTERLRVVADA